MTSHTTLGVIITPLAAEDPKQLFPEPLGLDTLRQNKTRQDKNPRKHAWGQVPLLGAPVPRVPGKPRMGATHRTGANGGQRGDHKGRPQGETTRYEGRPRGTDAGSG